MKRSNKPTPRYTIRPLVWKPAEDVPFTAFEADEIMIWKMPQTKGGSVWRFWSSVDPAKYIECRSLADAKRKAERLHHHRLMQWLEPVEE